MNSPNIKQKRIFTLCFLIISVIIFSANIFSCKKLPEEKIAVIWTDQIDFVSYCELFNSSQQEYKIIVKYKENPARELINSEIQPDVVIAPWLKGKAARSKFSKINNLFNNEKIKKTIFYPELLNLGNIEGAQYLLPVSFNLPMIIFSADNKKLVKNDFTLSLNEIKEISKPFNKKRGASYLKMGFSPRWSDDFLYMVAKGLKTEFQEDDNFFLWNKKNLQNTIDYIRNWSQTVNTSPSAEDDFKFKYLYDLPHIFLQNGRCLFYYASSENLFSMDQEKLKNIDFRWLAFQGKTPLKDDIVYAGICNDAKNKDVAEAFFIWLFNEKVQEQLLNRSNKMNLMVQNFGFAGGFSALREVTEKLLPQYYPLLLAHLPQTQNIYTPNILPSNWPQLKQSLIIPYLNKVCNLTIYPEGIPSLNKEITEWYKNK